MDTAQKRLETFIAENLEHVIGGTTNDTESQDYIIFDALYAKVIKPSHAKAPPDFIINVCKNYLQRHLGDQGQGRYSDIGVFSYPIGFSGKRGIAILPHVEKEMLNTISKLLPKRPNTPLSELCGPVLEYARRKAKTTEPPV